MIVVPEMLIPDPAVSHAMRVLLPFVDEGDSADAALRCFWQAWATALVAACLQAIRVVRLNPAAAALYGCLGLVLAAATWLSAFLTWLAARSLALAKTDRALSAQIAQQQKAVRRILRQHLRRAMPMKSSN